jgi:hypothetical protein
MSEPIPLFRHTPPWSTHREPNLFFHITYINYETIFPATNVIVTTLIQTISIFTAIIRKERDGNRGSVSAYISYRLAFDYAKVFRGLHRSLQANDRLL